MVKKKKGKKRNDSGIALNSPTKSSEDINTFLKNCKHVFHQPVDFTRIWKNALRSRGKERLKKLPCRISTIKFAGNSAAINFCARRS